MNCSFSHIINVVSDAEHAALAKVQCVTVESFRRAKEALNAGISVETIAVPDAGSDADVSFAEKSVRLSRSVTDVASFSTKRKLPLVNDILDAGVNAAQAEYIVFTNTDIALMPWFYNAVAQFLNRGHDALVINRRRIPLRLIDQPFELMVAHAGTEHIGFDCFVFRKPLYEKFVKTNICMGIPMAGGDLFHNLFTFAGQPALLANQHLTFHLGIDLVKQWGSSEYYAHNRKEFRLLLKKLKPHMQVAKFPGAGLPFFRRHFRWLMNPQYDYRTMCALDFSQWSSPRPKPVPEEIPGMAHRYYEWMQPKINFKEED